MSAEKVARLIADFDRPDPVKPPGRVVPFDHLQHSAIRPQHQPLVERHPRTPQPPQMQAQPPVTPEDDAYERGHADGVAAAKVEFEQQLAQEREVMAAQAALARQHLLDEAAIKLSADLTELGAQLQARIAAVAARMLEPLIANAVQKQAVANFVEQLASITTDSRRPVLRLTGPSELLEMIRGKLGARAMGIELRAGPDMDASITVDQIVLETQLKIWSDRLKQVVQS